MKWLYKKKEKSMSQLLKLLHQNSEGYCLVINSAMITQGNVSKSKTRNKLMLGTDIL